MSARGEVCLGDLVRALAELRPRDPATALRMAEMLGQRSRDTVNPRQGQGSPSADPPAVRPSGPSSAGADDPVTAFPEAVVLPSRAVPKALPGEAGRLTERSVGFSVTSLGGLRGATASPPEGHQPGEGADLLRRTRVAAEPAHEPPWKPDWARGIMFATVSTSVESRELDQSALLRKVARREALRAVPRRQRLSTRRGAQLLLDHGAGMAPFQDDRTWVHDLVGSIAGRDRVEVLRFRGTPGRGVVRRGPLVRERYRPPLPGTPVVLFSDLGRMRPPFAGVSTAGPEEWRAFIDVVLHSGCPVVCLTPYEPADYTAALRRRVAFIPFDRSISLRHARQATSGVRRWLERL
ncbi:hypothetical protein ABZ208_05385 [Streptomyces sp. NPDC006208]|uniref:hypothetical protein n=1 Tax=Streptomyces sp. NPDC006208 TaxID=3156734 RepID=UPI0033AF9B77